MVACKRGSPSGNVFAASSHNASLEAAYKHRGKRTTGAKGISRKRHTLRSRLSLARREVHGTSRERECDSIEANERRGLTCLGRYPFTCVAKRYLKGVRARLSESTIAERERKLQFLSRIVRNLKDSGKIASTNPARFTEDDIIEIFLALKGRGIAHETLRKHVGMLKSVSRESKNPIVDEMLAKGKIVVGTDHKEPFSLGTEEVERLLQGARQLGGWKGAVCCFSVAMMTFLRLRPGELEKAELRDLDTRRWSFLIANPKGKGLYGQEATLPIPDVLKPFVLEFLEEREKMLKSKGIAEAEALIPAVTPEGAGVYTQQAFGRLKKKLIEKSGISFKWKDFRPTGGQIALDNGVHIEQVSRSMRHASVVTTERYYCRARADLAYARVNEAYNHAFKREPAINGETV